MTGVEVQLWFWVRWVMGKGEHSLVSPAARKRTVYFAVGMSDW
jgi:hypothetical protein